MLEVVFVIVLSVLMFGIVIFFIVKKKLEKKLDYLIRSKKYNKQKKG